MVQKSPLRLHQVSSDPREPPREREELRKPPVSPETSHLAAQSSTEQPVVSRLRREGCRLWAGVYAGDSPG